MTDTHLQREVPNNIKITADSTCDLSKELLQKYDISISPLYINMGNKSLRDGIDVSPDDIYSYVGRTGEVPKTASVTVQDYLDLFTPYIIAGRAIVHFTISSQMSACYHNAMIAANKLGGVYVVDSRNLSTGIGHLALRAAELAAQGMDAPEIQRTVEADAEKLETSFIINTLKYLHKGGRCSAVAALGANLLSLKPCIEVKNGEMGVGKKYRGTLDKCLEAYVTDRLKGRDDIDFQRLFVSHSKLPPHVSSNVIKTISKLAPFEEIYETDTGCTIVNHCGPGTLGIIFFRK